MNYLDPITDFAFRTKQNLETIERLNRNSYTVFEVTQLINSCVGLLIIPQQEYWNRIPQKPIAELINEGWCVPEVYEDFPQVNDLRKLMRYLRNAIAHFNIRFESDNKDQLSKLILWNVNPDTNRTNWKVQLGISDLKILLYKFLDVLSEIRDEENLEALIRKYGKDDILNIAPFPKPWQSRTPDVKAIYLGCDPSNRSRDRFEYAFALERNNPKYNDFVKSHGENLAAIGLTWDNVYVQNLCRNYFAKETGDNLTLWKKAAKEFWIPRLKEELDRQFMKGIPVLLSAQSLLEVLGKNGAESIPAFDFYNCDIHIPIAPENNLLGRPLIPLYRGSNPRIHEPYHLSNPRWEKYRQSVFNAFNNQ